MIRFLSIKYQKPIAWILYVVFSLQTVFPMAAYSSVGVHFILPTVKKSGNIKDYLFPVKDKLLFADTYPASQEIALPSESEISFSSVKALDNVKMPDIKSSFKTDGPGPGQPEMNSFQSVNTTNMVDLFTGDFSYNIPLLDVGGYPVNIHYTGGISMDQDASWVGLGWNINPGTISRSMRGIPDDFNGQDSIARTQHIKPNKTVGVTVGGDLEAFGLPINVDASLGVFKNNYNGWGLETGINAPINSGSHSSGPLSGGLSLTNNSQTGLNISPSISVNLGKHDQDLNGKSTLSTNFNSRTGIAALQLNTQVRANNDITKKLSNALHVSEGSFPVSSSISFATPAYVPTISMPYTSTQFAFTVKAGSEHWGGHPNIYINGYVSQQEIKPEDVHQSLPAYGYLYYSLANNKPDALLDVNREKETQFNAKTSPMIAIPQYTYDLYSISGEGTGGMFRPYRGDVGFVGDHAMRTKSNTYNGSVDLGFGQIFHVGTDFIPTIANTQNGIWQNSAQNAINKYIGFQKSDSTFQEVYFRNPGEKTSNSLAYYNAIGGDTLMRIKLTGSKSNILASNAFTLVKNTKPVGEVTINARPGKLRDKRTQVITYLTAQEASLYGLDKTIKSYNENTIPLGNCSDAFTPLPRIDAIHKKHHISEIDVTNADGRRYVYGLPAYNVEQKEVTFSVDKETDTDNINKGLVRYIPGTDNSVRNSKGKDNYFTQDSMPGFAHDFLLTGILSPDYVDITGDGITQDDIGDAVKFNYTEVYGPSNNYFDWRAPYQENMANYNEGLKTYSRDDKGTYLYGKKEVWYLNSIESKTMIAVFKIKNDRLDSKAVKGENGGYNSSKGLRRLDEIDLYTKADLISNGTKAKPVKAVHFAYSYRLCPGIDPGMNGSAKLTLDSIWFSYNGNYKGKVNPYVFHYSPDANGNPKEDYNPSYNSKNYDRWGNFKNPADNPGNMSNVDFPYSVQDSAIAAKYASAWQLTDIQLPSSGRLKITYESDDYAYVQNRRAMQLFKIAGFGSGPAATPGNMIYTSSSADNYYLFVNSDVPLTDLSDLRSKYFGNGDTVYFKVAVKMPADMWGSGYEFVPGYGEIADLGITAGIPNQFWIRLKPIDGESPVTKAAIQFLRLNLPSKAYPGSEVGNDLDFGAAVKMLASSFREIQNAVNGFDKNARKKGFCQTADLSRSFVRLTNPGFKKYGGGSRVKRVELFDNWNKMTGQKESSYGQEYSYTTTEEINGQAITISSGVASYEPAIGNDENPFHEPISYAEKLAPLAPTNYMFVEEPVCESFFPSASVGYSKVTVRTINRKAKSANGWDETTFYTTKDFPTLVDYTVLDDYSKKRYNPKLSALLKINAKNYLTLSQGFRIQLNDMNGKMKSQASYAETDSLHPVKATYYYYKEDDPKSFQKHLNNVVPVVDSINGHINSKGIIGEDIEVMVDLREQSSKTTSQQFSPNVDLIPFFWFPLPIPSFWPLPQVEQTRFRSAATVKVIQRYGILDSVVVIDKGSIVSTKNLIYDAETGDVIVSRTNNEFNDPVYNFNYPAYWAYSGMGPAYQNIDAVFYHKGIMCVNGKLFYNHLSRSDFPATKFFESGDELWVHSDGTIPIDPGCEVDNIDVSGKSKKLWVMDAAKANENDRGLYLIDAAGVPYSGVIDSLKIIRSGKRNMVQASAGSVVCLTNPVREITPGNFKIVIDSNSQVLHTSATVYRDLWKVENSLYQKDTTVYVLQNMPTAYIPVSVTNFRRYDPKSGISDSYITNSSFLAASYEYLRYRNLFGCKSIDLYTKSSLTFDLSSLGAGAIITNASINLMPKVPKGYWSEFSNCRDDSYNWNNATTFYRNTTSAATISRITQDRPLSSWDPTTSYESFFLTSLHSINVNTNSINQPLNLTNLVQDMVNNPNYGLMFQSTTNTHNGNHYTFDYLSFCATNQPNINYPNCDYSGGQTFQKAQVSPLASSGGVSCSCSGLVLTVDYKQLVDSTYQVCRQNIVDSATNPYRWGMLGNWRVDRAYTYYGDRKEIDATDTITNIRKEGTLRAFSPFWQMTTNALIANPDTSKWVWNSAISLYNRKGFEIENYDPLGRYNSGLYGYNETLPVAVSQNGKYREELFDGFEDYDYKAQNCVLCPSPKEFDFVKDNAHVSISDNQSHTGLYSLKINAGFQAGLTVPITPVNSDSSGSYLGFKIDSTGVYDTTIVGQGKGITGTYVGYRSIFGYVYCGSTTPNVRIDTTIAFNWDATPPFSTLCNSYYTVTWDGFIQAPATGNFVFYGSSDYMIFLKINNQTLFPGNATGQSPPFHMAAGVLYPITVQYTYNNSQHSSVKLSWTGPGISIPDIVPKKYLYPQNMVTADTIGSIIKDLKKWCIRGENVKQHNLIRPAFSPLQGDHLALSAWVRIDATDCNTIPALDNIINVSFNSGGSGTSVSLKRTGVRIEGWQRYEGEVLVPAEATEMNITTSAPVANNIFLDDIKMEPFNGSSKSFIYNPINLRLMAELDENNYATFYEYDDDGTLIRVKKETERGIMTIQETRSALIKEE